MLDIFDDGKIFIICMMKEQAKEFQNLKYFEIDASFKRVNTIINNNTIKEWEITLYIKNLNKCEYSQLTLQRILIQRITRYNEVYYLFIV